MTITKNRVKELRARYDMTQEDLARKLNITRQTIIAIEREKYNPSLILAFKIARLFKCKIEEIFIFDELQNN
ncbi:transcriptional regulator [Candidatus Heimdallarchaeota archaeon B3_Heim]|nr:MAG: transcriptional regulator [Candidatus Heimdallarchaeota archaeon B3_Heim]